MVAVMKLPSSMMRKIAAVLRGYRTRNLITDRSQTWYMYRCASCYALPSSDTNASGPGTVNVFGRANDHADAGLHRKTNKERDTHFSADDNLRW